MSRSPLFSTSILALAVAALSLSTILLQQNSPVAAQGCIQLETSTAGAWPQGTATAKTTVTVYLDNSLSGWSDPDEINALKQAFANWSTDAAQSATGCNCHVEFSYTNTINAGTYRLAVLREVPEDDPTDRGEFHVLLTGGAGLTAAKIQIHPSTTNLTALTKAMAHEIVTRLESSTA